MQRNFLSLQARYRQVLPIALLLFIVSTALGQVYTNKPTLKMDAATKDSVSTREYPYSLPILGKKATKAGYNLPYSAGLGINYLWQQSDLVIEHLQVGFNNGPLHNLD